MATWKNSDVRTPKLKTDTYREAEPTCRLRTHSK